MNGPMTYTAALRTGLRAARVISLYAFAAVLASVFFFWLHHLGNGIPYEIAQQRFLDAPPENIPAHRLGLRSPYEYCEAAALVLGGAARGGRVENAVMQQVLRPQSPQANYCPEVLAASEGEKVDAKLYWKPRYWRGDKALFAIALRGLSVSEYLRVIEIATYGAWLAFAVALALHGSQALAVALPLALFGIAFSGISYFSDSVNGPGYLWAVSAATLLALSLRWRTTVCAYFPLCFAAGCLSMYLWQFDGHNFLAIALIGAVGWVGKGEGGQARRAFSGMVIYAAGFAVVFALGQTAKAATFEVFGEKYDVTGEFVTRFFFPAADSILRRVVSPKQKDKMDMDFSVFTTLTPGLSERQAEVIFSVSGVALGLAIAGAVFLARRRGDTGPIRSCVWFLGLMLAVSVSFMLPNDLPFRSARYLFLFPALCLSCLAIVAWRFWGTHGSLAVAAGAVLLAVWPTGSVVARQLVRGEAVEATLEGSVPLARAGLAGFNVYLGDDATLIYVKEACTEVDWGVKFFLHVYPFDEGDLTEEGRRKGREIVDFGFWNADYARIDDDGRCVAAQRLPDVGPDLISTGQLGRKGKLWQIDVKISQAGMPTAAKFVTAPQDSPSAEHRPVVRSHLYMFDVLSVPLGELHLPNGGAVEALGNDLLVATPRGSLALIHDGGAVEWLRGQVPMNNAGFERWDIRNPDPDGEVWTHNRWPFRVADILVKQADPDRWELFASHHYFSGNCIRFRVSSTMIERTVGERADWVAVSPAWRTVFDAEPCLNFPHHGQASGGKMLVDGPDRLLIVIGEHGRDGWGSEAKGRSPVLSQDPDSHFGKLISVDIATGRAEVLALGLRNPQGLARDRDGRLWASEHGPYGGDELNVLEKGRNYGWPWATYGLTYGKAVPKGIDATKAGSHEDFERPVYSWVPSVGVSAAIVNDGTRLPLWKEDILVGSLKGESLFRVRRAGNRVNYVERIGVAGGRIRDIAALPDGRIVLLRDGFSVSFLSLSREPCGENPETVYPVGHVYTLHCDSAAIH